MSPTSKSSRAKESAGDPNVAAILSWFLPGAGHLYLGKQVRALVAFAAVAGLYAAGLRLSGGMTFQFLDPELRSTFAPALSPESGCLGAIIYQIRTYGYGIDLDLWPPTIVYGSLLCALAGVVNILFMVSAHWDARGVKTGRGAAQHPPTAAALAWVFPGLAHFLQGRKLRGTILVALLFGLFVFGTILAEGSNLSRERHFYYWAGQFMIGLPAVVGEILGTGIRVRGPLPYGDVGLVFACVAGLLNVLSMIDAYAFAEDVALGRRSARGEAGDAEGAGTVAAPDGAEAG